MTDEKKTTKPTSLILDNLELKPYQYKEDFNYNNSLTIAARLVLSEEQYAMLGKFQPLIKVVRGGIDKEPREMRLAEIAWSKRDDEIKEEIRLFDKEEKERPPMMLRLNNLEVMVAKQSFIIDQLLNILVSNGIINKEKINAINAKITEELIWEKRRELNRTRADLDEFEGVEEDE